MATICLRFGVKFGEKFGVIRRKFVVKFGVNSEKILELTFRDERLSAAGIAEIINILKGLSKSN